MKTYAADMKKSDSTFCIMISIAYICNHHFQLRKTKNMKKQLFTSLLLFFIAINAMADNTISICQVAYEKEQPGGSSDVRVDFPLGADSPVRRAIIDYIFESLHGYPGVDIDYPLNTCDESTFKAFLEQFTTTLCQITADDQKEFAATFSDEDEPSYVTDWFSNLSILKVADTDQYVSYAVYTGEFCGGAHDNRGSSAITIRKTDGKRLNDIFVEDAEDNMQQLLWQYLIASEQPGDVKEYVESINDFLEANYSQRGHLHIPYGSIYLAPDGVHIEYQPLEICFWHMGAPDITIPYDAAKPFLTTEAVQLIFDK